MKVAVLGCGTIGRGVVNILLDGVKGVELKKILDKKEKFLPELKDYYTNDVNEILNDKTIDTVVETLGGKGFAYTCVKNALLSGKNVVTANKELVSYHLRELMEIAEKNGVYLLFEASVGGGIPFIKTISQLAEFNKTKSIVGILNGTTNYVLTKMQKENMDYASALRQAQELGFAEADPTADVEGHDMVRKISILSMLAYKQNVSPDDVFSFGITGVTEEFIEKVNSDGYTLKFVCYSDDDGDNLEIGVQPMLFKNDDVIANINYENNIVRFDMKPNDALTFIGKGAGRMPTATAIVADLTVIRDGGQHIIFEEKNNKKIGLNEKTVSAYVLSGEKTGLVENASVSQIRNGGYDFYAIIYKE